MSDFNPKQDLSRINFRHGRNLIDRSICMKVGERKKRVFYTELNFLSVYVASGLLNTERKYLTRRILSHSVVFPANDTNLILKPLTPQTNIHY